MYKKGINEFEKIPEEIKNMPNLEILEMPKNKIIDATNLKFAPNLKSIFLRLVIFKGIELKINQLPNLSSLQEITPNLE